MSEPRPTPPPSGGGLSGFLSQILGYIDKPWKAVVIVALFIIGGAGWVAYEKRNEILEQWMTPDQVELKTSEVPAALDKLSTELDADLVEIWQVDLTQNSQWFVAARRRGGERPVIPAPRRLPIITNTSDIKALVDVLEGRPSCVDLESHGSPFARRLADRGMQRGCVIPIPPSSESLVGVIYIIWSKALDKTAESVAAGATREVAKKLATH
jgi:hypothetical protein